MATVNVNSRTQNALVHEVKNFVATLPVKGSGLKLSAYLRSYSAAELSTLKDTPEVPLSVRKIIPDILRDERNRNNDLFVD